jgi:hypothetical protein
MNNHEIDTSTITGLVLLNIGLPEKLIKTI